MKPSQPPARPTPRCASSRLRAAWWLVLPWLAAGLWGSICTAEDTAAVEKRLADAARYLSSDELEGRGIGTKGLDLAAEYIAGQFDQFGLKTDLCEGTPFQHLLPITLAESGPESRLALVGPPGDNGKPAKSIELKPGADFSPLAASGAGEFDLPLVFVGYGITTEQEGYDDYAGVDVKGKAVIVLRHEPQQADQKSPFNGTRPSEHAPLRRKLANAHQHGAAAVIFCTDQVEVRRNVRRHHQQWQRALDRLAAESAKLKQATDPTLPEIEAQQKRVDELLRQVEAAGERLRGEHDPVLPFRAAAGSDSQGDLPVIHCRRAVVDRALKAALGTDLATLEEQIDHQSKPQSRELTGWRVSGRADVKRKRAGIKNVLALLEGEGPTAEEVIVVGAHYDHLGKGGFGSTLGRIARMLLTGQSQPSRIYNGADDNASGVAVLLEIAGSLARRPEKLRRSVLFVAFTGEERGLLGSAHYVRHPVIPLEKTVAMVNLDMVGRLRDQKLMVIGTGTAQVFEELLQRINQQYDLKLTLKPGSSANSDHRSFHIKRIPALHFFTGIHSDFHRPSDDFEKLNIAGMRQVSGLVSELVVALANAEDRPEYVDPPSRQRQPRK